MIAFFDDIVIGDALELGEYTFNSDEITRFARKYDPQPFHMEEEEAAKTHFKHLCASGWHTASVFMKLFVAKFKALHQEALDEGRTPAQYGPSPGFEDLKWIKPVYAGDTLRYSRVVTGKTESRSRPDWGLVHSDMLAHNQNDELVFSFRATVFVERNRPWGEANKGG
jgi:acyl dehydratase